MLKRVEFINCNQVLLKNNLNKVQYMIDGAVKKAGKQFQDITIVAVSKRKKASLIKEALDAGHVDFGENYVQEFLAKYDKPELKNAKWHFIGHLQSNKVKYLAGKVELIHSLSSISAAKEISKHGQSRDIKIKALLEVNISNELTKQGLLIENVEPMLEKVLGLPNVVVSGFMTIGSPEIEKAKIEFQKMNDLFEKMKNYSQNIKELSMGMTNDFEYAIESGATMVRIGTAIFGERI